MGNEDDRGALVAEPSQGREQPFHLGRRQRRGRLVQNDDPCPGKQHPGDLDQLLQADRQVAEPRQRIDVDTESRELLTGLARHAPPLHQTEAIGGLHAEKHVLGDRQIGRDAELLMDHGDAGCAGIADRPEPDFLAIQRKAAREFRVHAGDDFHQRALAGAVFADETVDLAGGKREVDPAKRLDAAEGLGDPVEFEDG